MNISSARLTKRSEELAAEVTEPDSLVKSLEAAVEAFLEVQREAGDRILESLEESCGTKLGEEVECGSLAAWHLDMEGVQLVGQEDTGRGRETWWRGLVRHLLAVLVIITVFTFCGLEIDYGSYYPATWHALRYQHYLTVAPLRARFSAVGRGRWQGFSIGVTIFYFISCDFLPPPLSLRPILYCSPFTRWTLGEPPSLPRPLTLLTYNS